MTSLCRLLVAKDMMQGTIGGDIQVKEKKMPRLPRFTFTINPKLSEPLKQQAEKEFRTAASLINSLIAKYLKEKGYDVDSEDDPK